MGFFDRFKKDKGIELTAPMKGKCVSIKEVPDPTFAEEILGKGIAVIPQDGHVYAPADGKISTVFPTGHARSVSRMTLTPKRMPLVKIQPIRSLASSVMSMVSKVFKQLLQLPQ